MDYNWRHHRLFMMFWLSVAMEDPSAFQLILGDASVLYAQHVNGTSDGRSMSMEATTYYTAVVREVSSRLADPVDGLSDGLISTVVGLACEDVRGHLI
jgi:hypothetical protein